MGLKKTKTSDVFILPYYLKGFLFRVMVYALSILTIFPALLSCESKKEEATIPEMDKKYLSESQLFALNQAVEKDPDEPENYYQRSRVYLERQDKRKALADIEKAISINPRQGKYYLLKGKILKSLKNYQEALNVLRQAEALRVNDAELMLLLAGLFMETGNTAKAVKYLDNAALLTPYHPEVYFLRGKILGIQGDTSLALANYFTVIHKDTGNTEAYKELARIYFNRKLYDSAMVFVTAGRIYEPNDAFFPYLEGRVLQTMNLEASALANYHTSLMMDSAQADVYNALGNFWYKKNDLVKASVYFEKELKYDPHSIHSSLYLADIYEKQDRGYLGIPLLEQVLKTDSLNKKARISLDRLYNKYPKPVIEEPVVKDTSKKAPVILPQPPPVKKDTLKPVKKDTLKKIQPVKPDPLSKKDTAAKVPSGKPKQKTKDTSGENTNLVPLITNPDSTKIDIPKE